ncbi:hypothetical protein ACIHCV_04840 [Streptomyces sp. NPDC051956]|uniref:hypothetical protein n=1 Tax=Streptomyces sp. NPDC051956 TaxID=3365677 RepID=UPI0037D038DB
MNEDVKISVKFLTTLRSAHQDVDGSPIPVDAMTEATEEYQRRTQEVADLITSYREQGRDLHELDGHPLLQTTLESMERFRQTSGAARDALRGNLDRMAAAIDDASALMEEIRRNRRERELSRKRFNEGCPCRPWRATPARPD